MAFPPYAELYPGRFGGSSGGMQLYAPPPWGGSRGLDMPLGYEMSALGAMMPYRDRMPLSMRSDPFRSPLSPMSMAFDDMDLYGPRRPLLRRGEMFRRPSYGGRLFDDEDDWNDIECDETLALLLRKMSGMLRGRGELHSRRMRRY
ncbi:hypothetical protein AMS68_006775 [Peltaster fructicola]|uniref:Uncharacterized protein n=1 Tax=Peltaster fructicola TaxID=286661 RepID=A0A6H0Y329_9PEZI|nr:hypothetical protein AMS68_006775 [Peltaster fructicola]